ncbi:hypothetical protein Enr13x_37060 [Stieleria neptunia]|uniref:Leucine Rich repeats (2 copies) n=2 Tax=Stieleria neptunia TaxID=2527979 RepID=A0A518HSN3_9BACT|nr:hypothetical protein Enr13x_37060 [Stieleria neptunia]
MDITKDSAGEIVEIVAFEGLSPDDDLLTKIPSLGKLRKLSLRCTPKNRVTVYEDWFLGKASLESIALVNCELSADAFSALLRVPALGSLDLTGASISPGALPKARFHAESVSFASCNLDDAFITRMIGCGVLDSAHLINLSGNAVTSNHILKLVARSTDCEELSLNQTHVDDESIPGLLKLRSLVALDMNDTKFTGNGFEKLCGLTRLEQLRANRVTLHLKQAEAFIEHPQLARFEFDYSGLSLEERIQLTKKQQSILSERRRK